MYTLTILFFYSKFYIKIINIFFWIWPRNIILNDWQLIIIIVKKNSWKKIHFGSSDYLILHRQARVGLESGQFACSPCVGTYIYFFRCSLERIRSLKHGWNKPWLAELLVIRTTKRGSSCMWAKPHRDIL